MREAQTALNTACTEAERITSSSLLDLGVSIKRPQGMTNEDYDLISGDALDSAKEEAA